MIDGTNFSAASLHANLLIANCFKIHLYVFEIRVGGMVVLKWCIVSALKASMTLIY